MILGCPSCGTNFQIDPKLLGSDGRTVRCGQCAHSWRQFLPTEETAAKASATEPSEAAAAPAPAAQPIRQLDELDEARRRSRSARPGGRAGGKLGGDPGGRAGGRAGGRGAGARIPGGSSRSRSARPGGRAGGKLGGDPGGRAGGRAGGARRGSQTLGWAVLLLVLGGLGLGGYFGRDVILEKLPQAASLYEPLGLMPPLLGHGLRIQIKPQRRLVDGERKLVIEGIIANVSSETLPVPRLRARLTDASGQAIDQWDFSVEAEPLPPGGTAGFETMTDVPAGQATIEVFFNETP